jgi:Inner membrane protein YgaP-like, transmembrane domain
MKKNIGLTDRRVRGLAAVVLIVAAFALGIGTVGGIIALVLAVVMAATAAVSVCPLYMPFGINTARHLSKTHGAR